MKREGNNAFFVFIAVLFIANIILLSLSFFVSNSSLQNKQKAIPSENTALQAPLKAPQDGVSVLSLEGFVKAEIDVKPALLIVKNGCKGIPMTPTEQQIRSIASALNNQSDVRPSAHDLMKEIFETYGIQVIQTKIVAAEESEEIYYARIAVKKDDKILTLDTKPSDAIAVALRAGIPIYIKQDILDKKGQDVCSKIA